MVAVQLDRVMVLALYASLVALVLAEFSAPVVLVVVRDRAVVGVHSAQVDGDNQLIYLKAALFDLLN